jgi:hypothetical protein
MSPRDECCARLVQIVDRERDVVLVGRTSVRRSRASCTRIFAIPVAKIAPPDQSATGVAPIELAVERPRRVDVVGEERDLDEVSYVAISNSRRTSFSDVLRSVDSLRDPTMSAHGRS